MFDAVRVSVYLSRGEGEEASRRTRARRACAVRTQFILNSERGATCYAILGGVTCYTHIHAYKMHIYAHACVHMDSSQTVHIQRGGHASTPHMHNTYTHKQILYVNTCA